MADYKGIHGGKVQNFSTNPPAPILGQVWYNETTRTLNYHAAAAAAWASGGNMNTSRHALAASGASNTAALAFTGTTNGDPPGITVNVESYDGSSWTEVNNVNTGRKLLSGLGTQTAALATGGTTGSLTAVVESWDGTNWTEVGDLNTARERATGVGTTTAALVFGGLTPGVTAINESWNGTSWTEVADLNTARYQVAGSGASNTSALVFGGNKPPNTAAGETEQWNGTAWTEVADLCQGGQLKGTGTTTSSLGVGREPSPSAATEEWTDPTLVTRSVDTD